VLLGKVVIFSLFLLGGILASSPAMGKISKQKRPMLKARASLFAGSPRLQKLGTGKSLLSFEHHLLKIKDLLITPTYIQFDIGHMVEHY
jgi:hypothetical protein